MTSQDEMRRQLNNAYIESKLSHIIEPMVAGLLRDKPSDNVSGTVDLTMAGGLHDKVPEEPLRQQVCK